ncbi:diaminopimelate decarboxylase [Brockia lithotrophica]|uniref:Diaminopimelate decarboxylase n=1 Tax=Brockia lithotrophica TaxID=933949 RepID=A0A660L431_9BACL|nr:diaminopimelate decarboxylase [Brockia lithotrophica]RKQ88666.1 diaminopimelate decarboxylase [Brockia lithotrophica]
MRKFPVELEVRGGVLFFGGVSAVELAERFGTPLLVYEEDKIRRAMREFRETLSGLGVRYRLFYACKAYCSLAMAHVVREEGFGADVVSMGEMITALRGGIPPEDLLFHGNFKLDEELRFAVEQGIGTIVVDNAYELERLASLAATQGGSRPIPILLRITPGVVAHTHRYILTGQEDSKFGFDLESGQALAAVRLAMRTEGLRLRGIHMHVGSQLVSSEGPVQAVRRLEALLTSVPEFVPEVLDLGGGFGVPYVVDDPHVPLRDLLVPVVEAVRELFSRLGHPEPELWWEPGRRVVASAGTTLYRVGGVKEIPGVRRYVAVDGGMNDNIRPALYQAQYEALLANRPLDPPEALYTVAGRLCESGDILIVDHPLPHPQPGDLLAVFVTGAYAYAMSSNYNRLPRPAVVFVRDGKARLVQRRETIEDLLALDLPYGFGDCETAPSEVPNAAARKALETRGAPEA